MKTIIISALFMLLGLLVLAQPIDSTEYRLAVQGGPNDRTLQFKPGKRLKLKTNTGEVIYTWHYSINDDHVLTEKNQMIYYNDIVRIKGRVMDNQDRMMGGIFLISVGIALSVPLAVVGSLAFYPFELLILCSPAFAIVYGGIRMVGHRTFKLDKGWEIQTYPAGE